MGTRIRVAIIIATLLFITPLLVQGQVIRYVDDDAPGDPGPGDSLVSDPLEDGTAAHPFDAIQEGIDAAVSGDTVLVADGTYTDNGNRNIHFFGKAITLTSANGPDGCIIDGSGGDPFYPAFWIQSGEGPDSVLSGFTITNFNTEFVGGIYCAASPTIIGNVITGNNGFDGGGGIRVEGSPMIVGNVISNNQSEHGGALFISGYVTPVIFNNLITGNISTDPLTGESGAIGCFGESQPLIIGCTIADNLGTGLATGIYGDWSSVVTVSDSIIRGNLNNQIHLEQGSVTWSNVEGGFTGLGNMDLNPFFVIGPGGDYHLSQLAAGQAIDSPCLDAGSGMATGICAALTTGPVCLGDVSTRTDRLRDSGTADMGYHSSALVTVAATFDCVPDGGSLPFQTLMSVELENRYASTTRRVAGRINVTLAGGQSYTSWRAGYTNIGVNDSYLASWVQSIPAIGSLMGGNHFTLAAEDVTPAPYNQPPHPPSGDTARAGCTVTGVAP